MSIEVIKNLQAELASLKEELGKSKSEAVAEAKEFAEKLATEMKETRKTSFDEAKYDIKGLQAKSADLALKAQLSGKSVSDFAEFKDLSEMVSKAIKPSDVTNWINNSFSSTLMEQLRLELKVEPLFSAYQIPDGVQSLQVPAKTSNTVAYLIQPGADAVESAVASGKVSFATSKLKTLVTIADETANESIITAIMDVVKADMVATIARASEDALVNGDTDLTASGVNGVTSANDVKAAFQGLRAYGMSNTVDFGAGADTTLLANFRKMRKQMGVYGINNADLVYIVSPSVMYRMLNIPEVMTMEKYGPKATILNGQIAELDGIPVIVSEAVGSGLAATGKVGGSLTGAVLVNRRYFATAIRGGNQAQIETFRNIVNSTNLVVAARYLDFKKLLASATAVAYGINISL